MKSILGYTFYKGENMENNTLAMAMAAYRSNASDENLGYLYQELLHSTFFVPVIIEQKQYASDVDILKNETHVNLYTMKNGEGARYYLLFSSKETLNEFAQLARKESIQLNFRDLVRLLQKEEAVAGILLDPASGNMVFEKDLIFTLAEIDEEPQDLN